MKRFSVKRLILSLIALSMAIITVCGLAAQLAGITDPYYGVSYGENGFTMLGFTSWIIPEDFSWAIYLMGSFSIVQLLVGAPAIIFSIISIFAFSKKGARTCCTVFMILCLIEQLMYLVQGIIYCSIAGAMYAYAFTTLSYVPLIFGVLCFVAYFVCAKKIRDKDEQMNAQPVMQPYYAGQADGYAQPAQQAPYYGAQPAQPSAYVAQPSAYAAQPAQPSAYVAQPSPYAAQPSAFAAQPVPPSPYAAPSAQQGGEKPAADTDMVTKLTQYKTLLDSGILSQEEFDRLKADLLKRQ